MQSIRNNVGVFFAFSGSAPAWGAPTAGPGAAIASSHRRVWTAARKRPAVGGDEDDVPAGHNGRMAWQAPRFVLVLVRVGTSVLIGGCANIMLISNVRARVNTSTIIIIQAA